jgi:heterodisulfide reductase subunit B
MKKEEFIKICKESNSMLDASKKIDISRHTFSKLAKEYGCYKTNKGGKGIKKPKSTKALTEDILAGKYPNYERTHLKQRLLQENIKENKCENCGIEEWLEKKLNMQLHHKDGNGKNNSLDNLQMLCPNCHAQTETYSGKNAKNKKAA